MPIPADFAALPQAFRDLQTALTRTITGRILGFAADQATGDPVVARVVKAAMISCYCYASTAPDEVLLEASARLSGWLLGTRPHAKSSIVLDPSGTRLDLVFHNSTATPNGLRASGASALLSPFKVRRAIGGPAPPTRARPPAKDFGTRVMRMGFSDALPFDDTDFRWLGTANGAVIDSTWTQPAAFGFWLPGRLMSIVVAFVAIESPSGVDVSLGDFGPPQDHKFGDTPGMLRHTPLTFVGQFNQPNTFRAVLRT